MSSSSGPRRSSRVTAAVAAASATTTTSTGTTSTNKNKKRPSTSRGSSATTTPAAKKKTAAKKQRQTGLSSAVGRTDTTTHHALGVIDPECTVQGTIVNDNGNNDPYDAMLVLVDPAKNMDKYFILQLIEKSSDATYVVYTRWGRTGTKGQALVQEFDDFVSAQTCFDDKFTQKSGVSWDDRKTTPTKGNKYRFVHQDYSQKQNAYSNAKWEYWVDDNVQGKTDGWYDYDEAASKQVEQLFHEHAQNPSLLSQRIVQSGGIYEYLVDMTTMTQTNTATKTSRRIRRCPISINATNNNEEEEDEEQEKDTTVVVAKTTKAPPTTPVKNSSSQTTSVVTPSHGGGSPPSFSTPIAPTTTKAAVVSPPNSQDDDVVAPATTTKTKSGGGSHPVDADIVVAGKVVSQYEVVQDSSSSDSLWYDVVLNQCNIGQNNNKYYRLQVLKVAGSGDSGPFYTWFKWGRVGEAAQKSSTTWSGPFQTESAAFNVFGKKYRDKTGNAFGTPNFVTKSNKYVPVEVDNDVDVNDPTLLSTKQTANDKPVEYMKSALDPKTKELVEVLFSKEMQSEALTSFNLDLKRLPLGVPSKAQIEHGISILREIEDKLNGRVASSQDETYEQLSSRFYTAIPHSFGRSVPSIIATKESLQSRYDMCNILLDMYDTNETVKRIEAETKVVSAKKLAPNPVDQFYASLKADLTLVQQNSPEDKIIRQYFDETKNSKSARILDVWSVNRQGEAERFAAYDAIENRRLLWHGTNIAVVAPILTTGLRIMPHSGGRVGAGIYLANLQQKSAQYTSGYGNKFACMFLCEAPLGKQHLVHQDGPHASGLRAAPTGYDSVQAVGKQHPKSTVTFQMDGKNVVVPNSGPGPSGEKQNSSFMHDEFLVYNEAQVRLRYVVTVKLY